MTYNAVVGNLICTVRVIIQVRKKWRLEMAKTGFKSIEKSIEMFHVSCWVARYFGRKIDQNVAQNRTLSN
jgi:hypothetical protein